MLHAGWEPARQRFKCIAMTELQTSHAPSVLPFSFDYSLTGLGWADADVTVGQQTVHLTASYLTDALKDLLHAVDRLWNGDAVAECSWAEEPGHYRWAFRLEAGGNCELSILARSGTRGSGVPVLDAGGSIPGDVPTAEEEALILRVVMPLVDLTQGISQGAARVLAILGPIGYLERWHRARFPLGLLRRVQSNAGLPPMEMPEPLPSPVDPGLEELWTSFLLGDRSAEATATRMAEKLPLPGRYNPLERRGRRLLKKWVDRGELLEEQRELAQTEFEAWRRGRARYAEDPMEWHRCEALQELAVALTFSRGHDPAVLPAFEAFLDRSDIEAMAAGMGYPIENSVATPPTETS